MALIATDRVFPLEGTSATEGRVVWDPVKSLWWFGHLLCGILAVSVYPSWGGMLVFVTLTGVTICAGHSVGMHRLLIHRSFEAPLSFKRLLVWLGTLVGMAGPLGIMRIHEIRDWQQHQAECAPFAAHQGGFWQDYWWQLHCRFDMAHPPQLVIEDSVAQDRFFRFVEATWMLQQIPVAVVLWNVGGWGWILWGISLRVVVSLTGHWMVVHFSHRGGHQGWRIAGLPVQGYNLPGLGLVTFGENWHGNHHAFPHSARLGVEPGQIDPGFWLIRVFERVGLAQAVQMPNSRPPRAGLQRVVSAAPSLPVGAPVS